MASKGDLPILLYYNTDHSYSLIKQKSARYGHGVRDSHGQAINESQFPYKKAGPLGLKATLD